jgi:LysR family transcriptional regulator for metE and metH
LFKPGLRFEPVFDYEQVLVVPRSHTLAGATHVLPKQLAQEILITYPVAPERLDVFNQFLTPAGIAPRQHRTIETTDILLQMVASGRGVTALPRWLIEEYAERMDIVPVRLGRHGLKKQIFLGLRESDGDVDYLQAFVELARG